MQPQTNRPVSGHVFRVTRARGPQWYAKYRTPDGRQIQKRLGPAWTERGRPPTGYFTKRTAKAWLQDQLVAVRNGHGPQPPSGDTFEDIVAGWLAHVQREAKPSTYADYKSIARRHFETLKPLAVEAR